MKISYYLKKPSRIIMILMNREKLNFLSDETAIKIMYKIKLGKKINLNNPKTFNEKLQWLKLYDRKPIYTSMVDKVEVKKYVSSTIGEEYVIPTICVWDSVEDIDFKHLPEKFVLKCTHNSGGLVICKDKSKLNIKKTIKKIKKNMKKNFFYSSREWPYKNVKPRILAESYIEDNNYKDESLRVYKLFCFNGIPKIIQAVKNDKRPDETIDYFDTEWNLLNLRQNYPNSQKPIECPRGLHKMLDIAKKISSDHAFLRVDFYEANDKIYFSEMTFFSDSGLAKFEPEKWDEILGEYIDLSKVKKDCTLNYM